MLFLITGFDPFGNSGLNASAEAVRALPTQWGDHQIVTATLPVVYDKCADALYELLDEYQPDVVLCLGQAVGREGISLEHAAVNVKASSSPDNAGVTFSGEKTSLEYLNGKSLKTKPFFASYTEIFGHEIGE